MGGLEANILIQQRAASPKHFCIGLDQVRIRCIYVEKRIDLDNINSNVNEDYILVS